MAVAVEGSDRKVLTDLAEGWVGNVNISLCPRTDRHARFVGTERVGVEQVWPPEYLNLESSACSTARVGVGGGKDRR